MAHPVSTAFMQLQQTRGFQHHAEYKCYILALFIYLSDVKFSEAGVQATTSTAEASVNTTSCKYSGTYLIAACT